MSKSKNKEVSYHYKLMKNDVKKKYYSKTKSEVDETFNLFEVKDEITRIRVIGAILSNGFAAELKAASNKHESKIMKKVEIKFLDKIYSRTIDEEDAKALNKLGFMNYVGIPDHFTDLLKMNSTYSWGNIEFAIEVGADLTVTNIDGQKILTTVLLNRQFEIAELLTNNGYDINLKDEEGRTSLFYVNKGDEDIAGWLIDNGIDVNAIDFNGQTATQYLNQRDN